MQNVNLVQEHASRLVITMRKALIFFFIIIIVSQSDSSRNTKLITCSHLLVDKGEQNAVANLKS